MSDAKEKNRGEPFPQQEFEGPHTVNRSCTDVLFLLIFIGYWVGMIVVASLAFDEGNPERLWKGYDFEGVLCGDGRNAGKKNLYYPVPFLTAYAICLDTCPEYIDGIMCARDNIWALPGDSGTICGTEMRSSYIKANPSKLVDSVKCLNNFSATAQFARKSLQNTLSNPVYNVSLGADDEDPPLGWCFPTYPSGPFVIKDSYARCLPNPFNNGETLKEGAEYSSTLSDGSTNVTTGVFSFDDLGSLYGGATSTITKMVANVAKNWGWILISAGISLIVCIGYTLILRMFAGVIAWVTLIGFELLLIGLAVVIFVKVGVLDPSAMPDEFADYVHEKSDDVSLPWSSQDAEDERKILLAIGIVTAILAAVGLIFLVACFKRINLAVKVIKEAGKCIQCVPMLLVVPVIAYLCIVALLAYWIVVFLYLFSAGTFDDSSHTFKLDNKLRGAVVYHFFGLLWTRTFFLALADISMSMAAATWYWKRDLLEATVLKAIVKTLRYHIGTAAFGSFIIALVEFVRAVVRYYSNRMKQWEKKAGCGQKIAFALRCCTECCLACLERFLKFASRQAYIQCAVHGTNFCKSAMVAFSLIFRNALRLATITVVSGIFLFLGKLFVALLTSFIGALLILNAEGKGVSDVTSADPLSVLLVFILAWAVASAFMKVYETVIDTLFHCFCEDLERSGSTGPKKCDPEFKKFMDENQATPDQADSV